MKVRFYVNVIVKILLPVVLVLCSCAAHQGAREAPLEGYRLFWSDEFDGVELDMTKWSHRYPGPRHSAVNVPEMVSLDGDGHLIITTRRVGDEVHTGMIGTQGKFETTYGYFECRVKLQRTHGNWSAFWLQSPDFGEFIGDPARSGAEIDIYECFEAKNEWITQNVHWDGYGEHHKHVGSGHISYPGLLDGWRVFGLEWTPDEFVFYVDGEESWRTDKGLSRRDEYIILSMEARPKHARVALSRENFEDAVAFDYVRVYKKI